VAERITGLTRRQIRYYEAAGLLTPARTPGNRRLYSPADLRRLGEIKQLREQGLELRAIAALAREGRPLEAKPEHGGGEAGHSSPGRLEGRDLGVFEDASARLLGHGPSVALNRLYPSEASRLERSRVAGGWPAAPASWLRLPRPVGGTSAQSRQAPSAASPSSRREVREAASDRPRRSGAGTRGGEDRGGR